MNENLEIKELTTIDEHIDELSHLLRTVVDDGASIGFLSPMEHSTAVDFWGHALRPHVILYIAWVEEAIAGTVQLHLCTKQNGTHRAEIAKMMVHPQFRQKGIAKKLMQTAEKRAKEEGRTLLILDTVEGAPSNHLYTSLGFVKGGRIPDYATSPYGELEATIIYYKHI
ncbi:GNAT family N-acetyltransferase [Rossellomorea vietnamensis]|uniref:GNAT family N-acetyltransferase n=1 Tax=Rossellomorea vietnamensis TaxID=218284 RepID=A0ACD4CC56_9BACI|nr:GNAT family N-acetyltransferase [Rossellomorea vietnamensis]UXH46120.1 GNAT family N-acetyltransferase [Rossellomorea vietnamensis]